MLGGVTLLDGAVIEIEIDSATVFDRVLATRPFRLGGGEVRFSFAQGVDPVLLETFEPGTFFLRLDDADATAATPGVAGRDLFGLDTVGLSAVAPGYRIDSIAFDSVNGFAVVAAPVPLPPVTFLLAAPLAWLARVARRQPHRTAG
ncbi:MAG: hypothetical protein RLW62_19905 [Gammaproteobacteria bacterium]